MFSLFNLQGTTGSQNSESSEAFATSTAANFFTISRFRSFVKNFFHIFTKMFSVFGFSLKRPFILSNIFPFVKDFFTFCTVFFFSYR